MKPIRAAPLAIAAVLGWVSMIPAHAVPPTATPSPGYDARLQEQRAASTRALCTGRASDEAAAPDQAESGELIALMRG